MITVGGVAGSGLSAVILGIMLLLFAIASGAVAIWAFVSPTAKNTHGVPSSDKARWVVDQDQAALAACEEEMRQFEERCANYLRANGFDQEVARFPRAAQQALDTLIQIRSGENGSRSAILAEQVAALDQELADLTTQMTETLVRAGFVAPASPSTPGSLKAPGTSGTLATPGVLRASSIPTTPEMPGAPSASSVPTTSEVPNASITPSAPTTLTAFQSSTSYPLDRDHITPDYALEEFKRAVQKIEEERLAASAKLEEANRRHGELAAILTNAKSARNFDELKLELEVLRAQYARSCDEYAETILAIKMLDRAIEAWDHKSQPVVYQRAGEFLSLMTDGAWTSVSLDDQENIQVSNDAKVTRDPIRLSLGTCEQLYLSLRIALLSSAQNVGRSIPIVADDILVNFDDVRQRGAARALLQLSQTRQVILLTCHEGIVGLMRQLDPNVQILEL